MAWNSVPVQLMNVVNGSAMLVARSTAAPVFHKAAVAGAEHAHDPWRGCGNDHGQCRQSGYTGGAAEAERAFQPRVVFAAVGVAGHGLKPLHKADGHGERQPETRDAMLNAAMAASPKPPAARLSTMVASALPQ